MISNNFFVYAQQRTFAGKDFYTRMAQSNMFLEKTFGKAARQQMYEEQRRGWESLITMINMVLSRKQNKYTVVVYCWADIANEKVIEGFLRGTIAVIVIDQLLEKFDEHDLTQYHLAKGGTVIDEGVVLEHSLDMRAKMRQYQDGRRANHNNLDNEAREKLAKKESLKIWRRMKDIARNKNITSQIGIEKEFYRMKIKRADGGRIGQHYLSRCLQRAGKRDEWRALKKEIRAQLTMTL